MGRARARLALAQNDQDRAAARQVMDKAFGDFDRSFSEARTRFYTDRGRALVTEVADMATAWRTVTQAYLAAATPEHLQQGSTELAANLFRATQTEEKLRKDQIRGKEKANKTHYDVAKKVRQTMADLGTTMPEDLPSEESIKVLQSRKKKELRSKGGSQATKKK